MSSNLNLKIQEKQQMKLNDNADYKTLVKHYNHGEESSREK
jgi:hypothetical protein